MKSFVCYCLLLRLFTTVLLRVCWNHSHALLVVQRASLAIIRFLRFKTLTFITNTNINIHNIVSTSSHGLRVSLFFVL